MSDEKGDKNNDKISDEKNPRGFVHVVTLLLFRCSASPRPLAESVLIRVPLLLCEVGGRDDLEA
jgi:hypothetical protein